MFRISMRPVLFSDIRPGASVELIGKEKSPFRQALRWASEGWLYWDLTCVRSDV